jgi:hypothetical protein
MSVNFRSLRKEDNRISSIFSIFLSVFFLFFHGDLDLHAQDCTYLSFANVTELVRNAASKGSPTEYEIAVLAVVEFKDGCPDFSDRVEALLAETDKEFVNRQMGTQYDLAENAERDVTKASALLLRSNNSKIFGLIAISVGSATILYSIPVSLLCTGIGGISYLRSISFERKAAKQLAAQGQ